MKSYFLMLAVTIVFTAASQKSLHLYGGKDHDIYLGCLNCDSYNSNSIWNSYGTYGSSYSTKSIWNSYSTYGSDYSSLSPFNAYAKDPPVVVDKDGGFYGYLSVNEYKNKRAEFKLALIIYKFYDLIRSDVPTWYDKIFNE